MKDVYRFPRNWKELLPNKHPKLIEAGPTLRVDQGKGQWNVWQQQWLVKMIKVGWCGLAHFFSTQK